MCNNTLKVSYNMNYNEQYEYEPVKYTLFIKP